MRDIETGKHYVTVMTNFPMGADELDGFLKQKNLELVNETVVPNAVKNGANVGNVWRYTFRRYSRFK